MITHLLEESWQVQLSWPRLVLQAVQAMHRTVRRVCQEVLLEGIRKAVVPAKWWSPLNKAAQRFIRHIWAQSVLSSPAFVPWVPRRSSHCTSSSGFVEALLDPPKQRRLSE